MNKEININKFINILNKIYENYKDNSYILSKFENYIQNHLESNLFSICNKEVKKYNQLKENATIKEEKKNKLIYEQELFYEKFTNLYKYYYINNTDMFIYYDLKKFYPVKEDNIIYHILSTISQEKSLIAWKHKIKFITIKKIKEKSIENIIPESETIQNCFKHLIPNVCKNKDSVKYFLLTIGDVILKKNENLIYLVNVSSKNLIKLIADNCYYYFGINLSNHFKYKYHEQINHNDYRLLDLKISEENLSIIQKNILDIFFVALHYSNRFNNSESYINTCYNFSLKKYTLYLKNNSISDLIEDFTNNNLIICENSHISSKNIIYLWKLYLKEKNLPNLIFQNTLKSLLKNKLNYEENRDIFTNISSSSLPLVSNFLDFWEKTIIDDEDELSLELSEIIILFKHWNKLNIKLDDALNIIDIIKHFYPDIIIANDKFIYNISCTLWNKKEDLNKFLDEFKIKLQEQGIKKNIYLNNIYNEYCNICKKNLIIVNKIYFDKYIIENLSEYIVENNSISYKWWM